MTLHALNSWYYWNAPLKKKQEKGNGLLPDNLPLEKVVAKIEDTDCYHEFHFQDKRQKWYKIIYKWPGKSSILLQATLTLAHETGPHEERPSYSQCISSAHSMYSRVHTHCRYCMPHQCPQATFLISRKIISWRIYFHAAQHQFSLRNYCANNLSSNLSALN